MSGPPRSFHPRNRGPPGTSTFRPGPTAERTSGRFGGPDGEISDEKLWLPVSLVLHPSAGTYDVYVDHSELATGRLTAGAGPAARVRIRVPAGSLAPAFAVDDVLVQPLTC